MKKTRTLVLLTMLAAAVVVFSFAAVLPFSRQAADSREALAGSLISDEFSDRFAENVPDGDGRHVLSASGPREQTFKLQSKYFNASFVEQNSGDYLTKPVFSAGDMNAIATNKFPQKIYNPGGEDNAAFVMLDDDDSSNSNYVVLEFECLTTIAAFSGTHNGAAIPFLESVSIPNTLGSVFWELDTNSEYHIRGIFAAEGYYEFSCYVAVSGMAYQLKPLKFGFYIGHASEYVDDAIALRRTMPVFDVDPLDKSSYTPSNNQRFFYNFQGDVPSIEFDASRYDVTILMTDYTNNVTDVNSAADGFDEYVFSGLGKYQVDAEMLLPIYDDNVLRTNVERTVRVPNFDAHRFYLDVFGFYGQYWDYERGCNAPFADETLGLNCDITSDTEFLPSDFYINPAASDAAKKTAAKNAIEDLVTRLGDVSSSLAVTNQPPVALRYNVSHAYYVDDETGLNKPLTRVAYKKNTPNAQWNFDTPYGNGLFPEYVVGKPFEQAGEYAVIAYYEYNAAGASVIFRQIFYFRIVDFAADVLLRVDGVSYTFDELMGATFETAQPISVEYKHSIGPFEAPVRVKVFYMNFARTEIYEVSNWENTLASPDELDRPDGIYIFRVYFGNNQLPPGPNTMPHMDFTAIVDTSTIKTFKCFQGSDPNNTGIKSDGTHGEWADGISVFGAGDVTLAWDRKPSGVDMCRDARIDFYAFERGSAVHSTDVGATVLKSQFGFSAPSPQVSRIVTTETGYKLYDKLRASGLYVITIEDAAGNLSRYTIIIDATSAAFAQNPGVPANDINTVFGDAFGNVTVGFGEYKLISDNYDLQTENAELHNFLFGCGLYHDGTNSGIVIPVEKAEMSTNGTSFTNVSGKSKLLEMAADAVTYFFRVTDLTGNVGSHYVELNPDRTRSVILEDSTPISVAGGIVSLSATVVGNGKIASRDYVTFSFMQAGSGTEWCVDEIRVAYYPFDFRRGSDGSPVSANYPFSDNTEKTASNADYETFSAGADFDYGTARQGITINRNSKTRQGLYVVWRKCHGGDERNYYFIVDSNPVISDANFETGIRIQFGASTFATHENFHKPNNTRMNPETDYVLRSNDTAQIWLPNAGSKYGIINSFNILDGDFSGGTTLPKTFDSFGISVAVEFRANGSETFAEKGDIRYLAENGMYRIAFTDGSGGYSWQLGAGVGERTDGNRSEVLVEIITSGPQGAYYVNGAPVAPGEYNNDTFSTGFMAGDSVTFVYTIKDSLNFLLPIYKVQPTNVTRSVDGTNFSTFGAAVITEYTIGTITFCRVEFPLAGVTDGTTFRVTLTNTGTNPNNNSRSFYLTLDNTPPKYNLNEIRKGDSFFGDSENRGMILAADGYNTPQEREKIVQSDGSIEIGNGNVLRYPFRLDNGYSFSRAPNESFGKRPGFDTKSISYFEVDSRLSNISGEHSLSYEDPRSFYQTAVDEGIMQADQNRFFRIVERDEAGNRADYFVQLRGDGYVDTIQASGVIIDGAAKTGNFVAEIGGEGVVRGNEMSVGNAYEFFANNLFFELTVGGTVIKRFGFNANVDTMVVGGVQMPANPELFAAELQRLIVAARGGIGGAGGVTTVTLNNRFRHASGNAGGYSWTLRQITRATKMFEITASESGGVTFAVDDSKLPSGLQGGANFYFRVLKLADQATPVTSPTLGRQHYVANKNQELLVIARDEFGREARFAYNGVYGNYLDFLYDEGMFREVGGDLYLGSGVEISYSTNAYDLEIYRNGSLVFLYGQNGQYFDAELADYVLQYTNGYITKISLLPREFETDAWSVLAYRRGTNALREWDFYLYGGLPKLMFTNQGGTEIDFDREINGVVVMSFSFEGLKFPASVEFTRTYTDADGNSRIDLVPISEYLTRYNLIYKGDYVVTVTNALGFSGTQYKFTINDVTNRYFKVFYNYGDGEEELTASSVAYHYDAQSIDVLNFFVGGSSFVAGNLRIEPTTNSSWEEAVPVATISGNIMIYRIRSTATHEDVFLAVTFAGSIHLDTLPGIEPLDIVEHGSFVGVDTTPLLQKVFYQPTYLPNEKITVGLSQDYVGFAGNLLYVDYFRDNSQKPAGTLCGTQETLEINARDYGTYRFIIYDRAGNKKIINSSVLDEKDERRYTYTIVNLARAPLYITESGSAPEPIADGMIYNGEVSLNVQSVSQYPGAFAKKMEIYRNDNRTDLGYETAVQARSVTIGAPGHYRAVVVYSLGGSDIVCEYNFVIASPSTAVQSFSYIVPDNTEITGIKLGGTEIRSRFADLGQIALNSATGNGTYVITLKMRADNIYQFARPKTITVRIMPILSVEVLSTVDYGTSTTSPVSISISPQAIYNEYGDCHVIILCNDQIVDKGDRTVGPRGDIGLDADIYQLARVSAAGRYTIRITSFDDTKEVRYSQEFEIKKAPNPLGTIVIVILVVLALGAVILFIRLRTGMRVK